MENEELVFQIAVHKDGTKVYTLNEKPWKFVDPSLIDVGSVIWFNPGKNEQYGVVCETRKGNFMYFYVNNGSMDKELEEVAEFQVFKVQTKEGNIYDNAN